MRRGTIGVILVVLMFITSDKELASQSHFMTLSSPDKLFGLSKLWQETNFLASASNNPDRVDADSLFKAYIPLVIRSANDYEYYKLLQRYSARFQEYHTRVEMPPALTDSLISIPIEIQEIRRRFYVINIDKKYADKMPVGSEIIRINGSDIRMYLETEVLPYISGSTLQGRMNEALHQITEGWIDTRLIIQYLTPDGREQNELFTRTWLNHNDRVNTTGSIRESVNLEWINREMALITINRFDQEALTLFLKTQQISKAKSIIIDLRNNNSEDVSIAIGIAIQLIEDSIIILPGFVVPEILIPFTRLNGDKILNFGKRDHPLSTERISIPDTLYLAKGSEEVPEVILLTGAGTGNAAEHFLMLIKQGNSRATIIGEPTAGNTGASVTFKLPGNGNGSVWARKDFYRLPTIPMTFITPDQMVTPDVKSLLNGEDPVLNRALKLAGKQP